MSSPVSNKLAKLCEARLELCRHANLRDDAVLPVSLQKDWYRELATQWFESIEGQKKKQLVTSALHKRIAKDFLSQAVSDVSNIYYCCDVLVSYAVRFIFGLCRNARQPLSSKLSSGLRRNARQSQSSKFTSGLCRNARQS